LITLGEVIPQAPVLDVEEFPIRDAQVSWTFEDGGLGSVCLLYLSRIWDLQRSGEGLTRDISMVWMGGVHLKAQSLVKISGTSWRVGKRRTLRDAQERAATATWKDKTRSTMKLDEFHYYILFITSAFMGE
jgi:hypothetical protein